MTEIEYDLLEFAKEKANEVESIDIDTLINLVLDGAEWMKN